VELDRLLIAACCASLAACAAFGGSSSSGSQQGDSADAAPADAGPPPPSNPACTIAAQGPATFKTEPSAPSPNTPVTIEVRGTAAYTNVNLALCTPDAARPLTNGHATVSGQSPYTWTFAEDAGLPRGTTQIQFRADPGQSTVYGVGSVTVE
jgi:hypothetical protein